MSTTDVKVVYGGGSFWAKPALREPEQVEQILAQLLAHGVTTIDTARVYERSEATLGAAQALARFTIDTKAPGGHARRPATAANIVDDARQSAADLGGGPVDVYYLHTPDTFGTPLDDTLAGIQEVFQSGFFARFGLSNFSAAQVQEVYDLCRQKGYPLPTVYQGRYGPADRWPEEELFPTLRKLGIAFYAYSPVAGGLLAKSKEEVLAGKGRFDPSHALGKSSMERYGKPEYLNILDEWAKIAEAEGVARTELAYRWVRFHSILKPEHGDAVIMGASSMPQLVETLGALESGPLSETAVAAIDGWSKRLQETIGRV